jgi:hypothetical protein
VDVGDGGGPELVGYGDLSGEVVERQRQQNGRGTDGGKDEEGGPLKEDELGSTGDAAVERNLRRGGMVDDVQLGVERGGPRDAGCGQIRGLMRRKKSFMEFTDSEQTAG